MNTRRVGWAVATPVLQILAVVAVAVTSRMLYSDRSGGWSDLASIVAAMVLGPSVAFAAVVGYHCRRFGVWRALGSSLVAGAGSMLLIVATLRITGTPLGVFAYLAATGWVSARLAR